MASGSSGLPHVRRVGGRQRLSTAEPEGPYVPLPTQLERLAEAHPERVFLHHRGRDWTYAEVLANARGLAAWLVARGVRPGDRVSLALPNSADYVVAYFGIQLAGACAVTLDVGLLGADLAYAIGHAGSIGAVLGPGPAQRIARAGVPLPSLRTIVLAGGASDAARHPGITTATMGEAQSTRACQLRRPSLDDLAQLIYTSGTTGRPKGVTLSHRSLAANTRSIIASLRLRDGDSVFAILPFSYSYGNSLLLTHVSIGGGVVVASDFVFWNAALDLMSDQQAAGLAGTPSSFAMLMDRTGFLRRSWPNLRYLTCAGGALPVPLVKRLREGLPHVSLYVMYGQTEATARLACLPPDQLGHKLGSAGRSIPGVELTIRDENGDVLPPGEVGEIVAHGDNVMLGYWNDREATREVLRPEGLFTGDLGRLDNEGYLFIVGRRSDIIKSGGYRLGPQEIEDALLEHPAVAEVAVVGRPDALMGEVPVAFVVPRGGAVEASASVLAFARQRLPRHQVVRHVYLVESLPRTSNGKLARAKLRQQLSARND